MIPRTDEPMEGVVFDVQDHTRQTGTSGPVHMGRWLAQTSTGLKSPSNGCWDGRDRNTLWWATAREGRRTFHLGHFGRARPRGDHPLQMGRFLLMDRTSSERVGCCLERVAGCWGHLARVAAWRSLSRANVWFSGCCACPKRANVSLRRAWRPSFSSFYDIFLALNVKTV